MRRNNFFRTCIILLCIAFLSMGFVSYGAESLSDLNSQKDKLQQEKADIQEKLNAQKEELEKTQKEHAQAVKDKAALMDEKTDMLEHLDEIIESIKQLDDTIKDTEEEYANKLVLLKERSRVMYQSSSYSDMQMLLESDNLLEYINRKSYYDAMIEKDQQLLEEVMLLKADLEAKKKIQGENKVDYEKMVAEKEILIANIAKEEADLSNISASTQAAIKNLEAMEDEMAKESAQIAEKIRKEQERIQKEKEEAAANQNKPTTAATPKPQGGSSSSGGSGFSGKLLWPSVSKRITSYFGMRMHPIYNYPRMHNGIDIGAAGGTNIYAAESGTVIISEFQVGGGYGNYVVIDHGNGMSTLYAHASKLIAKVGQKVNRGDVIALVGTTGNSTGNHLHFEVRKNGNPVDPLDYL